MDIPLQHACNKHSIPRGTPAAGLGGSSPDPGSTGTLTVRAGGPGQRRERPEDEGATLLPAPSRRQDDNPHGELATCRAPPGSQDHVKAGRGCLFLSRVTSEDMGGSRLEGSRCSQGPRSPHTKHTEEKCRSPRRPHSHPAGAGLTTSPPSPRGHSAKRGQSLAQGHRRFNSEGSNPPRCWAVCGMSHVCRRPLRGCCRTQEGEAKPGTAVPERLHGGMEVVRSGEPTHAGGRLVPPLTGSGNMGGRGQPQPKWGAQGHRAGSRARPGAGHSTNSLGSLAVSSKLPQFTRPPRLPQFPHCSLCPPLPGSVHLWALLTLSPRARGLLQGPPLATGLSSLLPHRPQLLGVSAG